MARNHGRLSAKEKKEIRQKRRALRKDLKKRGIKSRREFETIAQQMGLVYGNRRGLMGFFWWLSDLFGGKLLAVLLGFLVALMVLMYGYAVMTNKKEDYTIALSGDLNRIGLDLSETADFKDPQVRLKSTVMQEANAMSVSALPTDLDNYEGSHNGNYYMAYTFWIRNNGEETVDYDWHLVLNEVTNNVDQTLWVMIYDEGKQTIYAKAPEGAAAEKLSGYSEWPLYDQAASPDTQYYTSGSGQKGIATTPYTADREVATGTVKDFKPKDTHKYTVVMWIEGDDPECTNDTLGGKALYAFKFAVAGDTEGVFDDIVNNDDDYIKDTADKQNQGSGNPLKDILDRFRK